MEDKCEEMGNNDLELGFHEIVENVSEEGDELSLRIDLDDVNLIETRECFNIDGKVGEDPSVWVTDESEGVKVDVNLDLGLNVDPIDMEIETSDRDIQNKRPKIRSFNMDWDFENENEIDCSASIHERIGDEDVLDSIDDRDISDALTTGDVPEVRMDDLTDDLLHMVLSFLDQIDLCFSAMVCRRWRDASSHEDFWRYLNFENRNISRLQFEDVCRRYPNATAVNVYGTPRVYSLGNSALSSLRNIAVLTLGNCKLGYNFFEALTYCHTLRSLTIKDATITTPDLFFDHEKLHHLQIVKCDLFRVTIRCPQLETLSLKRSIVLHPVLICPILRELDISSCDKLREDVIRSATAACPLLESLDISNCSCIGDKTLREISLSCRNLHVLDASYCPKIVLESVMLHMLTVLKLHSCEGITSASMAAISNSRILEVLELDNCSFLTSVSLDLPHLQKISLVHCCKFVDLDLRSNMLSSIIVSNSPSLKRIGVASDALTKLVLQKQGSLAMLALECDCLEELTLTECQSLTNSICKVFSSRGGCSVLRSLVLDSWESLTGVSFRSTSLVSLSVRNCRAMTSLDLNCPRLKHISLDGCDHLERAKFSPVGLRSLNLGFCPILNVLHLEAPEMISLELKGCGVLSDAFIHCPLLTSLDASFCSQLKDDCLSATMLSCPPIESLVLTSCHSVGPDGLSCLRALRSLSYLDLSYTLLVNLQPVFDACLYLKVLKLQACKHLSDTSLEPLYKGNALPSLCELDLSYVSLCQSAIEELLACCRRLTHISLNGCANMQDICWGSRLSGNEEGSNRLLENLNCVGCPNIKKVVVPFAARCFHLSSLNFSLSSNLKEVDVSCRDLFILNLSNCYSLEILKLDCPKLTSLFLRSCNIKEEDVEAAIRDCNVLETLDIRFCPKISPLSTVKLRRACPSLKRIFNSLVPV